jgi:hypothetical protein
MNLYINHNHPSHSFSASGITNLNPGGVLFVQNEIVNPDMICARGADRKKR